MSKKSFCLVQILIVTMVIIGLLANTYAWSDRGRESGNKLALNYESVVNGNTAIISSSNIVCNTDEVALGMPVTVVNGDVFGCSAMVSNPVDGLRTNVSLFVKLTKPTEGSAVNNVIVNVSRPTIEEEMQSVVFDDNGTAWLRVVTSCEIEPGINDMLFEWTIEICDGGVFIIDDIALEYF